MERFVQAILGGGLALVAGLWVTRIVATGTAPWVLGALLVVVGVTGLSYGIWVELEV